MSFDWLEIAKHLEAIAQAGITFSRNEYDLERYDEIRAVSHKIFSEYTDTPLSKIRDLFLRETGYPTPKVDVRGVVFQDGRILLVQEKLDNCWSIPGGWADIGLTPNEVAVKEVREESGLQVIPLRLLAVMDKKKHNHPPSPLYVYKIFILCKKTGGQLQTGIETTGVNFFSREYLPPLSLERITPEQINLMFELYLNPEKMPWLD